VLDTNVFIEAERNPDELARLKAFTQENAANLYLSTVVMHELLAGVADPRDQAAVERHLLAPYPIDLRLVHTDERVWKEAAEIYRVLRFERAGNDDRVKLSSFWHDILITASCRSIGATLVTFNGKDFDAINDVNGFRYTTPFP
jgi:predicted nucleic acid-binding protein